MSQRNTKMRYKKEELYKLSRNHLISIILKQEKVITDMAAKLSDLKTELEARDVEILDMSSPDIISVEDLFKN